MRAGLLLRIALYTIGVYSLFNATTYGIYYLHEYLSPSTWSDLTPMPQTMSMLFGYCLGPLVFSLGCFGFAGAIERFLLGAAANERIDFSDASAVSALRVGGKLLGFYFIGMYASSLLGTGYEGLALRSGSNRFNNEQVTSDLIASVAGVGFGCVLVFRTDALVKLGASSRS